MINQTQKKRMKSVLLRQITAICLFFLLGAVNATGQDSIARAEQIQKITELDLPVGDLKTLREYQAADKTVNVPSFDKQFPAYRRSLRIQALKNGMPVIQNGTGDYGKSKLSPAQKELYVLLEQSLMNFMQMEDHKFTSLTLNNGGIRYTPFTVNFYNLQLEKDQASQTWIAFLADHPWVFWLGSCAYSSTGDMMPLVEEEFHDGWETIETINNKVEAGIAEYVSAVAGIRDTYEKVRIVYDKLINDVNYAYKEDGTTPEDANWAHSIIGVFDGQHNEVVCEGYAKTFSFLMNVLDIPNVYIVGLAGSAGEMGGHSWNAVSFDAGTSDQEKTYYYLDATWDDMCGKNSDFMPENKFTYFSMPKKTFEIKHAAFTPENEGMCWQYELPVLGDDMEYTYFSRYGAYGTSETVADDTKAREFLKTVRVLAPGEKCLMLLPKDLLKNSIAGALNLSSWGYIPTDYGEDMVLFAHPAEDFHASVPLSEFTLSKTRIDVDTEERNDQFITISSVTGNSDDYITFSSSDESVAVVKTPYVKAKEGEEIRILIRGEGEAVIYATSVAGGVEISCVVSVGKAEPTISPTVSPSAAPTVTSRPTVNPSAAPTVTSRPTISPSAAPTVTSRPTVSPSMLPTPLASQTPTVVPTLNPDVMPTWCPIPTGEPSTFVENPRISDEGITTWDCVYFGSYWQNDTNGDGVADQNDMKEPIKWRVLSVNGNDALLLADMNLDVHRYNDIDMDITWETCSLRKWLNGTFLDHAFSMTEQTALRNTIVSNNNNMLYGTKGGNNTVDKVYLLSVDEAVNPMYGFDLRQNGTGKRLSGNTAYTAQGGEMRVYGMNTAGTPDYWWLRSPGYSNSMAVCVMYYGNVVPVGIEVCHNVTVRPVVHLDLTDISIWSKAGTVSSDGTVNMPPQTPSTPKPTMPPEQSPGVTPSQSPVETPSAAPSQKPTLVPSPKSTENPDVPPTTVPTGKPVLLPSVSPRETTSPKVTSEPTHEPEQTAAPKYTLEPRPDETYPAIPSERPVINPLLTALSSSPVPTMTPVLGDEKNEDLEEGVEDKLQKGDYFMSGNLGYKITKLKGKTGEAAVVLIKSRKVKFINIPNKVKKKGITFSVKSIQKNVFQGCKKVKTLNIKATGLKKIAKRALSGLNKKVRIKIPKAKAKKYRKMLSKCGYEKNIK